MTAVLALDQGTTGSTALVLSDQGRLLGRGYREFAQHFPSPGEVEHDAEEILRVTVEAAREAIQQAGVTPQAIGITNQRETVCAWERGTGRPVHRAIVWQDRRTAARCAQLKKQKKETLVRARTGLVLDPYFSATKIEWLLEHVKGLRKRARDGAAARAAGSADGSARKATSSTGKRRTSSLPCRSQSPTAQRTAATKPRRNSTRDVIRASGLRQAGPCCRSNWCSRQARSGRSGS